MLQGKLMEGVKIAPGDKASMAGISVVGHCLILCSHMLPHRKLLTPLLIFVAAVISSACSPSGSGSAGSDDNGAPTNQPGTGTAESGDIPLLGQWQNNMINFGRQHCDADKIRAASTWEGSVWYYDGMRVYYQIADYTRDPFWNSCARYVRDVYRDYVLENGGRVPGWRVFPHGLFEDFLRSGDPESKRAVQLLATSSVFAASGGAEDFELSRETAYLIHAYLAAEDLGLGRFKQLQTSVRYALSHLDQWRSGRASYVKPFMVALTLEALINYADHFPDAQITNAILQTANWLWDYAWDPARKGFPYIKCQAASNHQECFEDHSGEGADLHLLIAPVYAWSYQQSRDARYLERGDKIFENGVRNSWLGGGKQFSQNYRWSFDFVRWRSEVK